jgi:hypothetical protein
MGTKMADDVARLGPGARPLALSLDEMALLLEHRIAMVRDGGDEDAAAYPTMLPASATTSSPRSSSAWTVPGSLGSPSSRSRC